MNSSTNPPSLPPDLNEEREDIKRQRAAVIASTNEMRRQLAEGNAARDRRAYEELCRQYTPLMRENAAAVAVMDARLSEIKRTLEGAGYAKLPAWVTAKLSERKTVHEWLNEAGVPREEQGRQLCLLRRLSIALGRHPHQPESKREAGDQVAPVPAPLQ